MLYRCGLSTRRRCSDCSNFGEPLDRVLVVPADGGFLRGRRLRDDVVRLVVEAGGVVGQHQVEVGDADVRWPELLRALLRPYPHGEMAAYAASMLVNSPSNDDPRCVAPLPAA